MVVFCRDVLVVPPHCAISMYHRQGSQPCKHTKSAASTLTHGSSSALPKRQQRRFIAHASPASSSSSSEFLPPEYAFLLPRARQDAGPRFEYSSEEAVTQQLQALQANDQPHYDHGIEVLYRFANFDPFVRSRYFGKSFDLGQFERFRRILHIPAYKPLLNHEAAETLSTLEVEEGVWKSRVFVKGPYGLDEGVYEFTMVQRLGGRYDGFWFTESLVADGNDWKAVHITY